MIALPDGVSVYAAGRVWTKKIPEHLCPDHLKPTPPAAPAAEPIKDEEVTVD